MAIGINQRVEGESGAAKYLTFLVDQVVYGLDIRLVQEVMGVCTMTGVPDTPDYIRGVTNVRGRVLPVVDVRTRFGRVPRADDDETCIIVVSIDGTAIGLLADAVGEVVDLPHAAIEPTRQMATDSAAQFVAGTGKINGEMIVILDLSQLVGAAAQVRGIENEGGRESVTRRV
jgi:purine-binding chemotaxis protein CheW